MKTFINILIRRILYRVPLFLLIIMIIIIGIWILYIKNVNVWDLLTYIK